jgi:hypothetical protein
VGRYFTRNVVYQTLTEHWNGSQWSIVSSPNSGKYSNELYGVVAVSANNIWAAGYNDNGSAYQTLTEFYC